MKNACRWNRRRFLSTAAWTAAGAAFPGRAHAAPTAPVAVARCRDYGPEMVPALRRMFDQLGGLGKLVRGKTVAVKVNLIGDPSIRLRHASAELAHWVHPAFIGGVVHLIGAAGATRIRILESAWRTIEPLEEYMLAAGWEPRDILNAAPRVEMENTNYLGRGKKYHRLWAPNGGHLFKAYDFNHSYEECDVFVSLAKLKEHKTCGITLSIKNCFGNLPCTIYGDGAPKDEPGRIPLGGRGFLHYGDRQPPASSLPENDPSSPRHGGYRVSRIIADIVAARPMHLALIDGIETMAGGEGPWSGDVRRVSPGLLVAGTNCVTTDAVGTALMGFDPMAVRGTAPFETCDSTLQLAEAHGVGTRDLRDIEVIGTPIREAVFDFRKAGART